MSTTYHTQKLGYLDRETERADIGFSGATIAIGALINALTLKVGSVPQTLFAAGSNLICKYY